MAGTSPVSRGVRMLVAPVDRVSGHAPVFDPAAQGRFTGVPDGWFDLGPVVNVNRVTDAAFAEVWSGAPALLKTHARAKVSASLSCTFAGWSKLAIALSGGCQTMNLLRAGGSAAHAYSGGTAEQAAALLAGSTATVLRLPSSSAVAAGDIVVVDDDYSGQTGYVGAAVAGAYVASADAVANSPDYVRRVSFNVARVLSVAADTSALVATLAAPLPAGVPSATMKLNVILGFADRAGGSFVQEWSALLVMDGVQGDRVLVHYPRLQSAATVAEGVDQLAPGLQRVRLRAQFHALPVTDPNDGEAVLCFRSYLPAPGRLV